MFTRYQRSMLLESPKENTVIPLTLNCLLVGPRSTNSPWCVPVRLSLNRTSFSSIMICFEDSSQYCLNLAWQSNYPLATTSRFNSPPVEKSLQFCIHEVACSPVVSKALQVPFFSHQRK